MGLRSLRQDVRQGVRLIRQNPGFATVTVLTLALGIGGANTAVFSILNALVLRNLPIWQPERLVEVAANYRNSREVPFSFSVFQLLQRESTSFLEMLTQNADLRTTPRRHRIMRKTGVPEVPQ